ncbi:MAG: adenylate kinase [Chloroflexi bacterium]|nr:adenylate kinase [Chloroflexota bacterium]
MSERFVVLLGPPGAGKGTQAAGLAHSLGLPHVASGDLFREALAKGTALGMKAKAYMERGELVPDDVTVAVMMERLGNADCAAGAILDGFPRSLGQARALDEALSARGTGVRRVVYLRVAEEELLQRLGGRWICRDCQTPYHVRSQPPQVAGRCDRCGGTLCQRVDDSVDTARERLRVYDRETAPLVEYYSRAGKLIEVDGERSIELVGKTLVEAVAA